MLPDFSFPRVRYTVDQAWKQLNNSTRVLPPQPGAVPFSEDLDERTENSEPEGFQQSNHYLIYSTIFFIIVTRTSPPAAAAYRYVPR
jgi:hypothetical protein